MVAVILLLLSQVAGAADGRSVPSAADIAKAEAMVKDLYKDEYARTKAADRVKLATELLEQAGQTVDDPASRYVLLRDARDLAAKAGDAELMMKAADGISAVFAIPQAESRAAAVDSLVAACNTATLATAACDELLESVDVAEAGDELAAALVLAKGAETTARRAGALSLVNAVKNKLAELEAIKSEGDKIKQQTAALKQSPTDPEANLAVGKYNCFFKHDWDSGVRMLAKGSDQALKAAALLDMKAGGDGADSDKLAAGDAWYELAAGADGPTKAAMQTHALGWYQSAVSGLTGLTKAKAEKRIAELSTQAAARPDRYVKLWATIRKAIADKRLKRWNIIGGGFSHQEFEELPTDGAILIGFTYSTKGNGNYPGVVQPIYKTPRGEVKGKVYGATGKDYSQPQTTKAKPGYAVGAIYARGGGGFDAFKPIYMKMTEKGLDPNDTYDGPYIGGRGGGEGTVGGDGNFIVGLHGKLGDKGDMQALSVITLTTETPKETTPAKPRRLPRPKVTK